MALLVNGAPPCVLFEDEHLLVVNKPAGINTHAPAPYTGEGLYDWLRHREPRWSPLAIIHRLDKDTSGVLVFSKSTAANRSLTRQFTERSVRKKYVLLGDRPVPSREFTARSALVRAGERYVSRPIAAGSVAETRFRVLRTDDQGRTLVEAEPLTGRTHQIRVHAADHGFPILGDSLYGGTPSQRLCLHAAEIILAHPVTSEETAFRAPADFSLDARSALREALISPELTNAYRVLHGAADGAPGLYVDRLDGFLLSTSETREPMPGRHSELLNALKQRHSPSGIYHKTLQRQPGKASAQEASPRHVFGQAAPDPLVIQENGIRFALSFNEGYSIGLFLDQRDNRRRLVTGHVAADFPWLRCAPQNAQVLNAFAYTCGFSVCAAAFGARTTSLDLSRRYLDWGRRNLQLNHLDPNEHEFIVGDAFDWMRRLARKKRAFDLVMLDPPTFSRSKEHGAFRVEEDYPALVQAAVPLLKPGAVLFASTNAATLKPESFLQMIGEALQCSNRRIVQSHYAPQPPDFPVSREEPAYLKTVWLRIEA